MAGAAGKPVLIRVKRKRGDLPPDELGRAAMDLQCVLARWW